MSESKFLAFDYGAESGRAIIGIVDGNRISLEEIHRFLNRQIEINGHLHWDFEYLFQELKKGLHFAVEKGHGDIESIGIDTWGIDFGFIDKDGVLLENPFSYRDSRTDGMVESVCKKVSREEIYSLTGIQFMQINSLFQLYSAVMNQNDIVNKSDKLLFMPDLFNYYLTGKKNSEYTIASTSQLLNAVTKNWEKRLFERLNLPYQIMAPIIQPGTIIGELLPQIAQQVGLKNRVDVIAVGCHDTASAVAAVPVQSVNWGYISSGTWSVIGTETNQPHLSMDALRNDFTNEGGVDNKIRFLRNVPGLWLLQECRKSWRKHGDSFDYAELTRMARNAQAFKCKIDPEDPMFLRPVDMPEAILDYCVKSHGQIPANKEETVRCIMESLAFKHKDVIEKINTITVNKIETIHIVGGGSQNDLLNQITADVCGVPVAANPVEATALGNIIVQAIAKGILPSLQKGREIVADSFPVKWYRPNDLRGIQLPQREGNSR